MRAKQTCMNFDESDRTLIVERRQSSRRRQLRSRAVARAARGARGPRRRVRGGGAARAGSMAVSTPEFWQAVQALGDRYYYPPTEMAGMPPPLFATLRLPRARPSSIQPRRLACVKSRSSRLAAQDRALFALTRAQRSAVLPATEILARVSRPAIGAESPDSHRRPPKSCVPHLPGGAPERRGHLRNPRSVGERECTGASQNRRRSVRDRALMHCTM